MKGPPVIDQLARSARELIADARERRSRGRLAEAVVLGHLALKAARTAAELDHALLAHTHLFLSECMDDFGYRAMERIHAKEAFLEYTRSATDPGCRAAFHLRLGHVALKSGDYALADYYFTASLAAAESGQADKQSQIQSLLALADLSIGRANLVSRLAPEGLAHLQDAANYIDRAMGLLDGYETNEWAYQQVLEIQSRLLLRSSDHLPGDQDAVRRAMLEQTQANLRKVLEHCHLTKCGAGTEVRVLNGLAGVLMRLGRFTEAADVQERAVDIGAGVQRVYPETVLGMLLFAAQHSNLDMTIRLCDMVMEGEEAAVSELASYSGEAAAVAAVGEIRTRSMRCLAILAHHASGSERAAAAMLVCVLRRKAAIADFEAEFWQAVHRDPDPAIVRARAELLGVRNRLSCAVVRGRGNDIWASVQEIERREEVLLVEMRARTSFAGPEREGTRRALTDLGGALLRGEQQWDALAGITLVAKPRPDLATVVARLPAQTVLIEFVKVEDYEAARDVFTGSARYWALLLNGAGRVHAFDLGGAAELDRDIARNLDVLREGDKLNHGPQLRAMAALHDVIWAPFATEIPDGSAVILCPDGTLNAVPFAALVRSDGAFLVEKYTIHHLATGRELDTPPVAGEDEGPSSASVVADPDYDLALGDDALHRVTSDGGIFAFERLPGGMPEAEAVREALGADTEILHSEAASEHAVRTLNKPVVLHFATHGVFNYQRPIGIDGISEEDRITLEGTYLRHVQTLSQCGLALTGINQADPGRTEDGFLTAYDIGGMNLLGTRLVVLSGCDTGRGAVLAGEGVLGLGRSFRIAGARHVVLSLWRLSNNEAVRQMREFYGLYAKGVNPAIALRDVQRARVARLRMALGHQPPPALWAAFIVQGF